MRNKKLYNAMGKIDDNIIKDALESNTAREKNYRLRNILEAVACVAVVCGFVALSLVLQGISKRSDNNIAASSGTKEMTEAMQTEDDTEELTTEAESIEVDPEQRLAEALSIVYGHEGTTKTQFKLLDSFDMNVYQTWRTPMLRVQKIYFDEAYDPEPVYSVDPENTSGDPVWYKGPYVRYYVSGYPEYDGEEQYVIHVDICGDDSVSICGINIDSSFEEFAQTFTALGFEVESGVWDALPYTTGRQTIVAQRDGMWITLEKASVLELESAYVYGAETPALSYENGIVPAILRMGVEVENYMPVEQYDMP